MELLPAETSMSFGHRFLIGHSRALLGFLGAVVFGCASPPPAEVVAPGSILALPENVGILVIHVDTNAPLSGLVANGRPITGELSAGRYAWLVRLPAGEYAWSDIAFAPDPKATSVQSWCPRRRIVRFNPLTDLQGVERSEYEFDVEAGVINYPGELILWAEYGICGMVSGVNIRNRNHSAMALQSLMKTHTSIVEDLPIRYAGSSGDEFLQFFVQERARITARAPEKAQ